MSKTIPSRPDDRAERLARALRDNLRRRKAQARDIAAENEDKAAVDAIAAGDG